MFPAQQTNGQGTSNGHERRFISGFQEIRDSLTAWFISKQDGVRYKVDYTEELSRRFETVFPGRNLSRAGYVGQSPTPADYRFYLTDESGREYELTEMSGGEQAVFPILFRCVKEQIANSVVLIDEVDLNLHPPAAQGFVSVLGRVAPKS